MSTSTIPETGAPPRPLLLDAGDSPVIVSGSTEATAPGRPRDRVSRLVRGPASEPRWARPGLLALLVVTAVLYLWDLSASGYANSFYAAAVQAGTQSWKAMFFGSLDSSNAITVDKPAFFLWPMEIAGRIFGFNSWSMLVPQALEGVAAVGLLAATVRRAVGPAAGLIAGAALALTPAAVLIFRFNNPDAMLVLLLVAAGYCVMRALEAASTRWVTLAGVLVGLGFITKMGQALLIVPALALTYLIAAPTSLRRRITDLVGAGVAMVAGAGWWIAIVQLWPASSRPYIGGSTDNSVLELAFGYNGLGRLFSSSTGGGGGSTAAAGSSFGGATGLSRLFSSEMGNEISWLLPAALVALVGGLWVTRRSPRTDHGRALLILFGGWLLVTGLTFSFMQGTIHPYYTVALAPAIAGVLAVGSRELWVRRSGLTARIGLAAVVAAAGAWSFVLLDRTSSWHPELRFVVAGLSILAIVGLLVPLGRLRKASRAVLVAGVVAGVLGTGAFAIATAAVPHTGSIPSVGPAAASSATGGGMGGGFGGGTGGTMRGGTAPTGTAPTGTGTPPTRPTGTGTGSGTSTGTETGTATNTGSATGSSASASTALVTALKASTTTWSAAVVGDQSAAELELSSGTAVMAIGGWSGSDASPTLAQFKADVAAGKIHYLISGTGMGGGRGGSTGTASQITAWVTAHYRASTVGGQTVYDLTAAATS